MKVLITGANGLLGQKLYLLLTKQDNSEVVACSKGVNKNSFISTNYLELDITDKISVNKVFNEVCPDIVINTAAMTNVDQCESEKERCWQINVSGVANLIEACKNNRTFLIQLSTDFIFDGSAGPLDENAKPDPVNYYGESKLAGEKLIIDSDIDWAIARTVLVYGLIQEMSRSNIILWVKQSLEQGKDINVVDDQWRTPTLAEDLAMGCYLIAKRRAKGIFNISGKDFLTPYRMAMKTADFFNLDTSLIHKTDSIRFTQAARRPLITGFNIKKAEDELNYNPHTFEEGLRILADQVDKYSNH
ncbi:MAG: SDR family oxidoreductase [Bacteroidetes bacterium]|nr:MAG: SDR family oxidoreductase [Bacteroidota bacterium]